MREKKPNKVKFFQLDPAQYMQVPLMDLVLITNLPCNEHLALATFCEVVSLHLISPPVTREALAMDSVREMFLFESSISVIFKDTAVNPDGRTTSAIVSPTDISS